MLERASPVFFQPTILVVQYRLCQQACESCHHQDFYYHILDALSLASLEDRINTTPLHTEYMVHVNFLIHTLLSVF